VSTTLYVSNLPFTATEHSLLAKFAKFGPVVSVRLARNPKTGASERCGHIEMERDADAQNALNWLNFTDFDGRVMSVIRAVASSTVRH
jgi:RNA recognition motif-containing protein